MIIIDSVGHVYFIRVKYYRVLCNLIRSMGADTPFALSTALAPEHMGPSSSCVP